MLDAILRWQRDAERTYVRPWGLAAPILVLLVCLPLLRPLRYTDVSENEQARLATVQAIVEYGTLAIDKTAFASTREKILVRHREGEPTGVRHYSRQGPVMAALLTGPYWLMHRLGWDLNEDAALVAYVLTLLAVTLPVTAAAALIYRMGRLFELNRAWRMVLAIVCVFGSGLVSYATALNSHAPAACLILGASACLLHAAMSKRDRATLGWVVLAGFCAALAAVIDFGAFIFLMLLSLVILAIRWSPGAKLGALACYALGAAPPLALHMALNIPITGDYRPGFLHPELTTLVQSGQPPPRSSNTRPVNDDNFDYVYPTLASLAALNFADGILGPHGLISHFPILLFGVGGVFAVLHRHWPQPLKALAFVTFGGALLIVGIYVILNPDWNQPMFSTRWFVLFMPLLIFWAGAWLRKQHHPVLWTGAALLALFSVAAGLVGAAAPFTPSRNGEYTLYAAARHLFRVSQTPQAQVIAEARLK